jgi:hypothetical protein
MGSPINRVTPPPSPRAERVVGPQHDQRQRHHAQEHRWDPFGPLVPIGGDHAGRCSHMSRQHLPTLPAIGRGTPPERFRSSV